MAVAMRCRCVAERQPQTKSCTAVETIDLTCGLHVETMMVSKSWSVVSQDQIIEQTRPLAVALASFPALRSGTGSALRSTQPVVIAYRPARRPNYPINLISLIPRGGPGDSFSLQRGRRSRARPRDETRSGISMPGAPRHPNTRRNARSRAEARIIRRAARSRRAPRPRVRNRRGAGGGRGRVDALVHVRTPTRGSGTHSFLDSSHVRSVTASYCHSPTTAGRLSR